MAAFFNKSSSAGLTYITRIAILCVLIVIAAFSVHIYHLINPTPYVSTQDGFKIVFPGVPGVNTIPSAKDGSGGTETGRLYDVLNQNAGTAYSVYVIRFTNLNASSLSASSTQTTLENDVAGIAQTLGATVSNGRIMPFDNLTAVYSDLIPTTKGEAQSTVLAFLKNKDLYMILGTGISSSKFEAFAKTFQFISS
jgi:hypothetical protein